MEDNKNIIDEKDIEMLAEMALEDESIADGDSDVRGINEDVEGASDGCQS